MAETNTERDKALRKAYGKATQALREKHREDFETLYAEAAKDEGVEWTPRKTPEQKAQEEFDSLLAQYPTLAQRVQQTVPVAVDDATQ